MTWKPSICYLFQQAKYAIIVEEDLDVSPDFFRYASICESNRRELDKRK